LLLSSPSETKPCAWCHHLMRLVTRSSTHQYLSYVFLHKIFGEGWLWL
jgi:hypothetical protein